MPHEFRLPLEIAEAGAAGIVVNWFKDEEQAVRRGDLLLEVQFAKVTTAVYAPADEVMAAILIPPGAAVKPGQPLCLLRAPGEAAVSGRELRSAAQRVTGERMLQSLRETAQLTLGREVEVTALVALRAQLKQRGSPVTLTDLIHRAVVLALAEQPRLQARLDGEALLIPAAVHLGFAVARGDDLLVPVIRDAGALSLAALAAERARLTGLVQGGRLAAAEMQGATFTVSNLGVYGVEFFTPILNPPQAAMLGVGRTAERAAFREGVVAPVQHLSLSLTVDHRVVNGAPAATFLMRLAELLAAPAAWAGGA